MGVPKFFRWLSERYPCLSEELKEYQIPEFDNLYLDMNGIIHVCSHPNDFDPHFRISEEQIFTDIFHYIEVLFRLIRPQKLFMMAVDGVAPRAKMNQQRGRRFSSAKEAETLEKKALEKGEELPKEKRFDSNCITPGTEFMARLQEQLKYFVVNKISNDKLWQKPKIVLSGHSVPGEGEHKIMDYIRYLRSQPDWDPLTRHCLYGLDADLIILGLCTHEPNFSLLREEVKFVKSSKNKRTATPETTNYVLLHLSLLRGYLELEFQSVKNKLSFGYDFEKIIDDWVLLGFLVGNDFVPHLPHLHIHCNALGILYDTYRTALPKLNGYINENGVLNLERFEKFLVELSQFDNDHFSETYADMKYFESKTGRKLFPENQVDAEDGSKRPKIDEDALQALINQTELEMFDFGDDKSDLDEALESNGLETINDEEEQDKLFFKEFSQHKRDYYVNKMGYPSVSSEVMKHEAEEYVLALQWILFYYYRGCPSWSWYYPHHYSPYVSDLRNFMDMDVRFNLARPFLPFQQLLAVLPAASKEFLPIGYQQLMTSQESPIIDYYPNSFKVDLNGKRQEWEAVVLIPFIEEDRLLSAMEPYNSELTSNEQFRNSHGPMQIYTYSSESLGNYSAPKYFPDIASNFAKCTEIFPSDLAVPLEKLVVGRHPKLTGVEFTYVSGFPVLSALKITGKLEKKSVKVFEHASRSENMILKLAERAEMRRSLDKIADDFFSKEHVYVSYPHLAPARVKMLVSENNTAIRRGGDDSCRFDLQKNNGSASDLWKKKLSSLQDHHMNRFGIDLHDCSVVVYAQPLEGTKLSFSRQGRAFREMIWSQEVVGYPLDTCLLSVKKEKRTESVGKLSVADVFPVGTAAFMIGPVCYGCSSEVIQVNQNDDQLTVVSKRTSEPDMSRVHEAVDNSFTTYFPGYVCAERLGISSHLFARITSGIMVQSPHTDSDKSNIGLSLKFAKHNKQMIGYTRREGDKKWFYTDKSVELVREYMDKFPDLFMYLAEHVGEDIFFKDKMFPNDPNAARLTEIKTWLKSLEKGETRPVESELLEPSVVKVLEEVVTGYEEATVTLTTMKLKPYLLYLPKPNLMVTSPDPCAEHELLDRIVFVRESHSIPVGAKGTIIGIEKKASTGLVCEGSGWEEAATLYDVMFDKEVVGGQALFGSTKKLIYRLTKQVFINVSYGERKYGDYPKNSSKKPSANRTSSGRPEKQQANWRTKMPQVKGNAPNGLASSPSKPSGSVTNFFNAYRNNSSNTNEVGKTGQNRPSGRIVIPDHVENTQTDQLTDMWNLLKNLQVNSSNGSEQQRPSNPSRPKNNNKVESQTFTRSKQHDPVGQPSSDLPTGLVFHNSNHPPQPQQQVNNNNLNNAASSPLPPPPGHFPPLFTRHQCDEQTEALKKILCIIPGKGSNEDINNTDTTQKLGNQLRMPDRSNSETDNKPSRNCGHLPTCYDYFSNLLALYNLKLPTIKRTSTPEGFVFSCCFPDGFNFGGSCRSNPDDAKQDMACKGIQLLSNRFGKGSTSHDHISSEDRESVSNNANFINPSLPPKVSTRQDVPISEDRSSDGNSRTLPKYGYIHNENREVPAYNNWRTPPKFGFTHNENRKVSADGKWWAYGKPSSSSVTQPGTDGNWHEPSVKYDLNIRSGFVPLQVTRSQSGVGTTTSPKHNYSHQNESPVKRQVMSQHGSVRPFPLGMQHEQQHFQTPVQDLNMQPTTEVDSRKKRNRKGMRLAAKFQNPIVPK